MNLCDDLMMLMQMMLSLNYLRIVAATITVVTSTIIAAAVVVWVAAYVIAVNHPLTIYASVHPKIDH